MPPQKMSKKIAWERMEAVYRQNPKIGRIALTEAARVTLHYAQQFIREKQYGPPPEPSPEPEAQHQEEPGTKIDSKYGQDSAEIITKSPHITTLQEALTEAKVDLETWEVSAHTINFWTVTIKNAQSEPEQVKNYQVKIWLKRKVTNHVETALANLTAQILERPVTVSRLPAIERLRALQILFWTTSVLRRWSCATFINWGIGESLLCEDSHSAPTPMIDGRTLSRLRATWELRCAQI